jgi:hypothetical protein
MVWQEYSDAVYVGQGVGSDAHAAEAELLDEMLDWLPHRYPDRFRVQRDPDGAALMVETLTPGYMHTFAVVEYAEAPLKLAALLVQEEFYLMVCATTCIQLTASSDSISGSHQKRNLVVQFPGSTHACLLDKEELSSMCGILCCNLVCAQMESEADPDDEQHPSGRCGNHRFPAFSPI